MKRYDIAQEDKNVVRFRGLRVLYHFDCYRINAPEEILELGWEAIIKKRGNLVVVEWAEIIKEIFPQEAVWIELIARGENERELGVRTQRP